MKPNALNAPSTLYWRSTNTSEAPAQLDQGFRILCRLPYFVSPTNEIMTFVSVMASEIVRGSTLYLAFLTTTKVTMGDIEHKSAQLPDEI